MTEYTLLCERKAAFETNSSSSHSLVIDENSPLMTQEEVVEQTISKDGNIKVFLSEWDGCDKTNEIEQKLSYLYSFCKDLPATKSSEYSTLLTNTIEEYSGLQVVIENPNTIYVYCDSDELEKLFKQGKQAILDFLFKPKSYFQINRD